MFTIWYVAEDEAIDAILSEEGDLAPTTLEGIGELELFALGHVLGVKYSPSLVREEEAMVLRVDRPMLSALAGAADLDSVADRWQQTADNLRDTDRGDLLATLAVMQKCARAGLEGPGVIALPAF